MVEHGERSCSGRPFGSGAVERPLCSTLPLGASYGREQAPVQRKHPINAALVPTLQRPGNISHALPLAPPLPQLRLLLDTNHLRAIGSMEHLPICKELEDVASTGRTRRRNPSFTDDCYRPIAACRGVESGPTPDTPNTKPKRFTSLDYIIRSH